MDNFFLNSIRIFIIFDDSQAAAAAPVPVAQGSLFAVKIERIVLTVFSSFRGVRHSLDTQEAMPYDVESPATRTLLTFL